jgi:hypothetical protein
MKLSVLALLIVFSSSAFPRPPDYLGFLGPDRGIVTMVAKWCDLEYKIQIKANSVSDIDTLESLDLITKWLRDSEKKSGNVACAGKEF